jgi:hypothetical protein
MRSHARRLTAQVPLSILGVPERQASKRLRALKRQQTGAVKDRWLKLARWRPSSVYPAVTTSCPSKNAVSARRMGSTRTSPVSLQE